LSHSYAFCFYLVQDAAGLRQLNKNALEARMGTLDAAFRADMADLTARYDKARKAIEEAMASAAMPS
jgi:C terminal SARAH domain of Mst1